MSTSKRRVLALGVFRLKMGDAVIERGMEGIVAAAGAMDSATEALVRLSASATGWPHTRRSAGEGNDISVG